jgi:hypothetical protein
MRLEMRLTVRPVTVAKGRSGRPDAPSSKREVKLALDCNSPWASTTFASLALARGDGEYCSAGHRRDDDLIMVDVPRVPGPPAERPNERR